MCLARRSSVYLAMSSNHKDTYTMPVKQLLKLLDTTADDATRRPRRPRIRLDAKPAAGIEIPEQELERF
jgi:hypothetical protein